MDNKKKSNEDLHKQHADHFAEHNKGLHNYGYHMDQNPEKANVKEAVEHHLISISNPGDDSHIHNVADVGEDTREVAIKNDADEGMLRK